MLDKSTEVERCLWENTVGKLSVLLMQGGGSFFIEKFISGIIPIVDIFNLFQSSVDVGKSDFSTKRESIIPNTHKYW